MKTALIFLAVAILIIAGVYYYYLSIGGTSLETLFNNALGLQSEEEESDGLPIVVDVAPYIAVIAVLLGVGIFLHYRGKKRARNALNRSGGV
jgi:amino acid permease